MLINDIYFNSAHMADLTSLWFVYETKGDVML